MNQKFQLTKNEYQAIESLLKTMSAIAKYPISLESLFKDWNTFVDDVEGGYKLTIYDYTNDLSSRDLINRIQQNSPRSLQTKIDSKIKPLDERFKRATKILNHPLKSISSKELWWWFCIPTNPGDELRKDLEFEGLL